MDDQRDYDEERENARLMHEECEGCEGCTPPASDGPARDMWDELRQPDAWGDFDFFDFDY